MANDNLPKLPPLKEVLTELRKHSKQPSSDKIDYKKEYESLKKTVEALQERLERQEKQKELNLELKTKTEEQNCPILEKETGSGRIVIIENLGKKEVICKYLYEKMNLYMQLRSIPGDPACEISNKCCPYAI